MSRIYYTNPDGTIGSMEATHDHTGRLMPVGESHSSYESDNYKGLNSQTYIAKKNVGSTYSNYVYPITDQKTRKKKVKHEINSKEQIDSLFSTWENSKFIPNEKIIKQWHKKIIDKQLVSYFDQKLQVYLENINPKNQDNLEKKAEVPFKPILKKTKIDSIFETWNKTDYRPTGQKAKEYLCRITDEELKSYFIQKLKDYLDVAEFISVESFLSGKNDSQNVSNNTTSKFAERNTKDKKQSKKATKTKNKSQEIDVLYISRLISSFARNNEPIPLSVINKVKKKITSRTIYDYFTERCNKHNSVYSLNSSRKGKKSSSNLYSSSGFPNISSASKDIKGFGPRKPKYGYARDRFGRIQERDHYIENRNSNPYHNNSNYDREDDHDSVYDMFE